MIPEMNSPMLKLENSILIIIDVQGKLAKMVDDHEAVIQNLRKLIKGAKILDLPILWIEQYPEGIGATISEIAELLPEIQPFRKITFSCCGSEDFMLALAALNRRQILIAGIETHVCVHQTVLELMSQHYMVQVVGDAVSSRSAQDREIALAKMRAVGAVITSVETALLELLRTAEHPKFKELLRLLK